MSEENRNVFDQQFERYDAWYDSTTGRDILTAELDALRPLLVDLPHPWLEVGVGTGRMAGALGVDVGIDPARGALALAGRRGVGVVAGRAEALPFRSSTFGLALFVTSLCFIADPRSALREAARVLGPGGAIVLGIIPADGPWGRHYRQLAAEGHPYYRQAHFFTRPELADLLSSAGFRPIRARSALSWPPTATPAGLPTAEPPHEGDHNAGFLALLATKK